MKSTKRDLALIEDVHFRSEDGYIKLSFLAVGPDKDAMIFILTGGELDSFLINNKVNRYKDLEGKLCWVDPPIKGKRASSRLLNLCSSQDYHSILTNDSELFRKAAKDYLKL